jgi:CubicO group peptidase (beta-lactamase class C family)
MNICRPFRSGSILFLIGFLVCINSASALASNGSEIRQFNLTDPRELGAFINGVINAQLMAHQIPGATVAVVKDGKLIFAKGYEYADVDKRTRVLPMRPYFERDR